MANQARSGKFSIVTGASSGIGLALVDVAHAMAWIC